MLKRKIENISDGNGFDDAAAERAVRRRRQQLDGLLEQGKTALFQALKVARGIERQKLGRRQKTAKVEGNDVDAARLVAEIAALKSLELPTTAEIHLYKTLLKIKSIATSPSFPKHVQHLVDKARKPLDSASANVQARMFKSAAVQQAMAKSLSDIRALLLVEDVNPGSKKRMRAKDYANTDPGKGTEDVIPQSEEEWAGFSSPGQLSTDSELEGSDASEADYDMYTSRIAASSDDDSQPEDSDSELDSKNPESITESSSSTSPPPKTNPPKKPPAPSKTKSTTFLPSLSMGGYFSGSESAEDVSDDEPKERRNKRGQQARRAIWEKKFGKNANHLRNQPLDRDEGWDPRRGASGGDERGKRGRGGRGGNVNGGRGPLSSGANTYPVALRKPKSAVDKPLHPSWEAAKKAKEQKKAVPFQGKKIVFD